MSFKKQEKDKFQKIENSVYRIILGGSKYAPISFWGGLLMIL